MAAGLANLAARQTRVALPPDRRLRVFLSSTIEELAPERAAARRAVEELGLVPIYFEAGARPHPPRALYRAYLAQSDVFVGIYWQRYGWIAPEESVSGLEDEWLLAGERPRLVYVKAPAYERDSRLAELLARMQTAGAVSYRTFSSPEELEELLQDDLAVMLTEQFQSQSVPAPLHVAELPPRQWLPRRVPPPTPPTVLVGRDREIEDVLALVARPDVRLLTLTGPGGIGKTRVALEVVRRLTELGRDVAWVGSVSALRNAELVASAIAQALGIDERPGQDAFDVVVDELRDTAGLIAIDGFETVLGAADQVAQLLVECPDVTVLLTSRAVLNIRAEHDYPIAPLPVSVSGGRGSDRARSDAVRLFVEAATAALPTFHLTDDNADTIAQICRRLDGIPLAIELAAPRVRLLTPDGLLARLANRLDVLTAGATDLPERHQTLRAALAWDYDLLDGNERALFRRLAICEGGFDLSLAAVAAGVAGGTTFDLLQGLDSLVGKSLLRLQRQPTGRDRYTMLDTVRDYALERLVESGEEQEARDAHAQHLLTRLDTLDLHGPGQLDAFDDIAVNLDNFRVALRWLFDSGATIDALRMVALLGHFWRNRGHLVEGGHWARQALERAADIDHPVRVEVFIGAAQFDRARGDFAAALRLLGEARSLAERIGVPETLAHVHYALAAVLGESGDNTAAQTEAATAYSIYEQLGDDRGRAQSLNALGVSAEERGELARAGAFYHRALELLLVSGDRRGIALALMNLGGVLTKLGAPQDGRMLLERSIAMWRRLDNAWYGADCLEFLGYAVAECGDLDEAVRLLGTAAALRTRIGSKRPQSQQAEYDERLAAMKAKLSAAAFEAAWVRGTRERMDVPDSSSDDPALGDVGADVLAAIHSFRAAP